MNDFFCICDNCKEEKETFLCSNKLIRGRECNKNICYDCRIICEACDWKFRDIEYICSYCSITCNKCKKNICYKCEEKYGRCEKCWYDSPLCDWCENVEANYKCELCYREVCYKHKKICYNCGTKCTDCHENYYKASCKDCKDNLSSDDVEKPNKL